MITRRANLAASAALALLGAAFLAGGIGYGVFIDGGLVGPGFLPAAAGMALLVLALVDLVQHVLRIEGTDAVDDALYEGLVEDRPLTTDMLQTAPDADIFGRDQRARTRQLIMVVVALIVAVALVPLIGLLVSLGLLMAFAAIVVERRSVVVSLIVTAVTVGFLYLVFVIVLGIPVPVGVLGGD